MLKKQKAQAAKAIIIILLVIIAAGIFYIGYKLTNRSTTAGNVMKEVTKCRANTDCNGEWCSSNGDCVECLHNYQCNSGLCSNGVCQSVKAAQQIQENNDAEILNQAFDFIRGCILNCPKECPSCGVFSLTCVKSCSDSARSKVNGKDFSEEEIIRLLNDRNLKWKACMTPCDNSDSVGEYIDIDCLRGCGN